MDFFQGCCRYLAERKKNPYENFFAPHNASQWASILCGFFSILLLCILPFFFFPIPSLFPLFLKCIHVKGLHVAPCRVTVNANMRLGSMFCHASSSRGQRLVLIRVAHAERSLFRLPGGLLGTVFTLGLRGGISLIGERRSSGRTCVSRVPLEHVYMLSWQPQTCLCCLFKIGRLG